MLPRYFQQCRRRQVEIWASVLARGQMLTIGHHPQKRQSFARRRNACGRRVNVLYLKVTWGKRGQDRRRVITHQGLFPDLFNGVCSYFQPARVETNFHSLKLKT